MTAEQLEGVLSGRVYSASLSAGEDAYRLSGTTRPEDLDLQMQVLTAYLTDAGWRPEPFERARSQFRTILPQLDSTPANAFARDASDLLRSGDARWAIPTLEQVSSWSLDDLRTMVSRDLSQGPIEVIIVGDVDVDAAIQSVAATVGSLPARGPAATPSAEARTSTFPAGTAQPIEIKHGGRADQAMGFVAWPTSDNFTDPREARMVRLLADVLRRQLHNGPALRPDPRRAPMLQRRLSRPPCWGNSISTSSSPRKQQRALGPTVFSSPTDPTSRAPSASAKPGRASAPKPKWTRRPTAPRRTPVHSTPTTSCCAHSRSCATFHQTTCAAS